MDNENMTVEQLCDYLANNDNSTGEPIGVAMPSLADRIHAAHKRELAAKDPEIEKLKFEIMTLKSEQRTAGEVIAEQTNKVMAKDAEIARLTNIINTECNKCVDCAKFGSDCSASDVDGNEDCCACSGFVSKEIASLRALVNKLADALEKIDNMYDGDMCKLFINTKHCSCCKYLKDCLTGVAHNTLIKHESEIAKARKVVNG